MGETIGEKLRRNTRASMLAWAWGQGIFFIRMPLFIGVLGTEHYGLWMLAFAIMSYFELNNFGINTAFINYTAEYHAKKDYEGLGHLLGTGMLAALAISIVGMLILLFFTAPIIGFFRLEQPENVDAARFVVIGVGFATALKIALGVYRAVLTGLQRIDLVNWWHVFFLTLELGLAAFLFWLGYGIYGLVWTYLFSTVGMTFAFAWSVKRHLPELRISPFLARRYCVRAMVHLGGMMQLLGAVALIVATIDNIVLTRYEGLAFFGAYVVAKRFATRAQSAALQGVGSLIPASAELIARRDFTMLAHVYATAMRFLCAGLGYLFGFIYINGDYCMRLFMGDQYDPLSSEALQWLTIAVAVHTLTGPGTSMLRGAGRPEREIFYQLVTLVGFFALFFLGQAWGNERIIILSYSGGLALGSIVFIAMSNPYFRSPYTSHLLRMVLLTALGPAFAWGLRALVHLPDVMQASRWDALGLIVLMGVPYTVLFSVAAWFVPGLTRTDREQIVKFIPGGQRIMAKWFAQGG